MSYTVPAGRYGDTSTAFIQAYIDQAIAGVIDLAPETLNSLNELAAAINDDPAFYATVASQVSELNTDVTALNAALGIAENDSDVGTFSSPTLPDGTTLRAVLEAFAGAYDTTKSNLEAADTALSGRIDTLEADPTTATSVAAVQADVDQNELDSDAADTALSGRLDTLEADPTTQTVVDALETALDGRLNVLEADPVTKTYVDTEVAALVDTAPGALDTLNELAAALSDDANFATTVTNSIAAVQADVDQNESDSDAADTALSDRLDVLEADPTTATAVAAVQADVDQNESDADAAIALKLDIASPAATGKLTVDSSASLEFDSNLTKVHNELRGTSIVIGNNITLNPAAANGRVEIEGEFYLRPSDLTDAADDTAAAAAGIIVGQVYRNGSQLMVRVS
jgi:hypothetical protein